MPYRHEPDVSKKTYISQANGYNIGQSAMQGWRETMEDEHMIVPHLVDAPHISVYGIFDGHGGSLVSKAISKHIVQEIILSLRTSTGIISHAPTNLAQALRKAFLNSDRHFKNQAEFKQQTDEMGSTGLVVLLTDAHVVVGNVGDTRCIISTKTSVVRSLSIDHKPSEEMEKQRIVHAGGFVLRNRVCGAVAISRSFGDYCFKENDDLEDHEQQITAEPSIMIYPRCKSDDEFLVLACDGIYDVLRNQQIQTFVREKLSRGYRNPGMICELLIDECLARGSRDNMTVILIIFNPHRPIIGSGRKGSKHRIRSACNIQ